MEISTKVDNFFIAVVVVLVLFIALTTIIASIALAVARVGQSHDAKTSRGWRKRKLCK